jgi:mono/diheme cytochrome c family protein
MLLPRTLRITLAITLAAISHGPAGAQGQLPPPASRTVDFEKDILPIFRRHCFDCHGPKEQESGLRVDRRSSLIRGGDSGEAAVEVGASQRSLLVRVIAGLDDDLQMPPKGEKLSSTDIGLIRKWIDSGFHWPKSYLLEDRDPRLDRWSYQPLTRPKPPRTRSRWTRNPIDQFILARLSRQRLKPSGMAGEQGLLRRITLVTLGLPPTLEQLDSFQDLEDDQNYRRLVEAMLESPQFGERWARHWLDLVRFGETHGFETNRERPDAWPYRDYVIAAFNNDLPYDQFLREQIAGDAIGADPAATGYLVAGPSDVVKGRDKNLALVQRQDELADIVNVTGTAMLGLSLGCARCHNHKFDPVSQVDYFAIQAVFAGVNHGTRSVPAGPEQARQLATVETRIGELRRQLQQFIPLAEARFQLIDDNAPAADGRAGVEALEPRGGESRNPEGRARGQKDDPGGDGHPANTSGGTYSWWPNRPAEVVLNYRPLTRGRFRIWLSWGSHHPDATTSAEYLLDGDGNPLSTDDQQSLARVNQQRFADGTRSEQKGSSLWSGYQDAGIHQLTPATTILLKAGSDGKVVTADMLLLEKVDAGSTDQPAATHPVFRTAVNALHNIEVFPPLLSRFVRFTIHDTNSSQPCIDELEVFSGKENVALASRGTRPTASSTLPNYPIHKLEHINDGRFGNSHSWISNETSRGWVQLEFPRAATIDRVEWARDREGKYSDRVAVKYTIESSLDGKEWQPIASSDDRLGPTSLAAATVRYRFEGFPVDVARRGRQMLEEIDSLVRRRATLQLTRTVYAGTFSEPGVTYRLHRGDTLAPREAVGPETISAFGSLGIQPGTAEQQRRLAFANWITSPENPLTPRVIVNRLWQHYFGTAIVDTPSDFGANGTEPTHPELLDWLAVELVEHGWSLKHIHRLILDSATFRQSSAPRARGLSVDSDSRLLWRFPPRRLEAEPIRDSILFVSGMLNLRPGGPGFSGFEVQMENVRHYFPLKSYGPEHWRRMIYMTKIRQEQDSVFGLFDCPDGSQVMPQRSRSTTPLQALNLFNSQFVIQQAEFMAKRLIDEAGENPADQARHAFLLTFSRPPETAELEDCVSLIEEHGLVALCRALVNSNEFLFIP